MSLRTLVVDDERQARRRLCRLLEGLPEVEVVGEASDGDQLGEALRRAGRVDLLLLDVRMPGRSGLEARDLLGPDAPATVYVTAHDDEAVRAFAQGAVDYLLKPVHPERLAVAVSRARARLASTRAHAKQRLALDSAGGLLLLEPSRILYARLDGPLVGVGTEDGEVLTDLPLSRLEAELGGERFVRIHRRALVNLDAVRRLEPNGRGGMWAHVRDGTRLPVSRQAARALRRRFGLS